MKTKNLIFITLLILIISIVYFFKNEIWGEPESTLEKTQINTNKKGVKSLGFEDISGTTWENQIDDSTSSELGFIIDGLKDTKGFFEKFDIVFKVSDKNSNNAKMRVVIDVGSINTANNSRDKELMEEDFFNYQKHPNISYFSKNIERTENDYISNGMIEMMGEKHELSFKFKHKGIAKNKKNINVAIFEGEIEIDRTMFGMSHISSVGDIVKLHFYCELIQKL